jgi:hypothetical protein
MIEQYYRPKYVFEQGPDSEGTDGDRACPVCRRVDATTKASSISRSSRGRFVLEDGTAAAYESELGGLLSRPPMPLPLSGSILLTAYIVGWILLGLDLALVAVLQAQDSLSIPRAALEMATYLGLAWFGLLIPGAALLRYFLRREAVNHELPLWRHDVRRWQAFHYCSRDDLVFVPGEGHGVAPEHLGVLYRRGPAHPVIPLRQKEARA